MSPHVCLQSPCQCQLPFQKYIFADAWLPWIPHSHPLFAGEDWGRNRWQEEQNQTPEQTPSQSSKVTAQNIYKVKHNKLHQEAARMTEALSVYQQRLANLCVYILNPAVWFITKWPT